MRILLVGASSYVGARIFYDLKDKYDITGTYCHNPLTELFLPLDITDTIAVENLLAEIEPNVIVHTANYPSPSMSKNNEDNFTKLNKSGTVNLVNTANKIEAKLVFISSQAANNPDDNLYGQLKAESEKIISETKAGFLILRPSLMIGFSPNTTNPRPFNRILECLDDRSHTGKFDTSWVLQPTYVGHLAAVVERIIESGDWNKIVPIFINELATQYQIAQDILGYFGVSSEPVDQHIDIPPSKDDITFFNSLKLLPFTYKGLISLCIDEINNREKFTLREYDR